MRPFSVLRYLATSGSNIMLRHSGFRMDVMPSQYIDLKRMSALFGLKEEQINALSLYPLRAKLYDETVDESNTINLMSRVLRKDKRYYCPLCLQKLPVYKLLWQINGLEICEEHHSKLVSNCPACGLDLPYMGQHLQECTCPHCKASLIDQVEEVVENVDVIAEQKKQYNEWTYILYSQHPIVPRLMDFTYEKSLVLTLMYLKMKSPDVKLGELRWPSFRRFVKDEPDGKRLSVQSLFDILKRLGVSITSLSDFDIKHEMVTQILTTQRLERKPGPCLAPWCSSYDKSDKIVDLGARQNWHCFSLCTSCFMQYGYKVGEGEWREANGKITFIWDSVRPLLQQGQPVTEIARVLGSDRRTIHKCEAYLAYHGVIDAYGRYEAIKIPDDIVNLFRKLVIEETSEVKMFRKGRVLYGWDQSTFQYYLASREVQMYLNFECSRPVKQKTGVSEVWEKRVHQELYQMMKDGDIITLNSVAERLNCSTDPFRSHNLLEAIYEVAATQKEMASNAELASLKSIAIRYFRECEDRRIQATVQSVHDKWGMSKPTIRFKHPELIIWLKDQLISHKERVRRLAMDDYKELCQSIFQDLRMEDGKVTIHGVAKHLGLHDSVIRVKYPELVEFIKKEILSLNPLNL